MEENRVRDSDFNQSQASSAVKAGSSAHFVSNHRISRSATRPQHLGVVTETCAPEINGVALTLANLVKGLLSRGHTVSVVHPKQRKQGFFDSPRSVCYSEELFVRGLPLPGNKGLQFGLPAGRLLRQSWRLHPPAVVYVATEGPLGWSAIQAARALDIPTVSGFHTNFHHYCKHYGIGWMQNLAFRYLRWFHNQTGRTLVSNEFLRAELEEAGLERVDVLDRGVDKQLFSPKRRSTQLRREWDLTDDDLALIYVGRIAPEKNLELAIEAYRSMRRHGDKIRFVVVGDGPARRSLQREYPELIFVGMQTGERLARYYASADIFLFPSKTETFGNVTLEAMASGLAVIAFDYACAKMHISHGETGVLARFGDSKAFVDSACTLVQEPQVISRIRRQARQYVAYLDWPRAAEKFETLLMNADRRPRCETPSPIRRNGLAT